MTKQEILDHKGYKYVESLPPKQRYSALFGETKADIEKALDVRIEQWPYTDFPQVTDDMAATAVVDYNNVGCIAVLIPNTK